MMTPFNCRDDNEGMKMCLQKCGRDQEAFDAFRERRLTELEAALIAKQERDALASVSASIANKPLS